jgi:hypothetical protein
MKAIWGLGDPGGQLSEVRALGIAPSVSCPVLVAYVSTRGRFA